MGLGGSTFLALAVLPCQRCRALRVQDMLKVWRLNRHGGVVRCLKALLRQKLVHHDNTRYDGYRLTPLGYDFLALKALVARGAITAVGRQIGVGKESDVFEARVSTYSAHPASPLLLLCCCPNACRNFLQLKSCISGT